MPPHKVLPALLWSPPQTPLAGPGVSLLTMYDLPSEDPEEPGLPDIFHDVQPQLLRETFRPPHYTDDDVFVASDLNLYYDLAHPLWHKRPDWMAVLGVPLLYGGHDLRLSYVMWDERVVPYLIVELLSPGTEDEDLGKTQRKPDDPPTKWEVYEQILAVPYYVVFNRYTDTVRYFRLTNGRYQELFPSGQGLWLPEAEVGLGLWQGTYTGAERQWLRFYDASGAWILSPAEEANQRAEEANQRAEEAGQRAEEAGQRAEEASQRAQRLLAQLKALGIEPNL